MLSLKKHYSEKVIPELKQVMGLSTDMGVPKITKVTLNMGVGEVLTDKKILENAVQDLSLISGQRPMITKVRKSVANFKIREGMPIGCKVTLRGDRMFEFLQHLTIFAHRYTVLHTGIQQHFVKHNNLLKNPEQFA